MAKLSAKELVAALRDVEAGKRMTMVMARSIAQQAADELERLHAVDLNLEWDGKGLIFDPRCPCEKCSAGRADQRRRLAVAA